MVKAAPAGSSSRTEENAITKLSSSLSGGEEAETFEEIVKFFLKDPSPTRLLGFGPVSAGSFDLLRTL